jgi:putative hydrolase of the HAD superfamily
MAARPMDQPEIKIVFFDVGGVLLTNGWDRHMRQRACEKFGLDHDEMDERHHLTFDTYETGKIDLKTYLDRVVFYQERPFTHEDLKQFMFDQSQPYEDMLELARGLARRGGLRLGVISNEARELAEFRNDRFRLREFIEVFVVSSFVNYRKPDEDIYRLALDVSGTEAGNSLYIEDRPMFVDVARGLGMHGIVHKGYEHTRDRLAEMGLRPAEPSRTRA